VKNNLNERDSFSEQNPWLDYTEIGDDSSEPALGEKWREKAYSAKEQLVDAFVEDDAIFTLVAHGKVKNDNCGTFMRRKVKLLKGCLRVHLHNQIGVTIDGTDYRNKVFVKRAFYSCNRPECPSCGVSAWAVREAGRAEGILTYASNKLKMKIEHFIISPPQDFSGSFEDLRKYVLKAMLRRGIVGGLFIYHHFRYHGKNETYVGEKPHYFVGRHFHVLGFIKGSYGNCRNCIYQKNGTFAKCKEGCNGFEGVSRRAYDKDGVIAKVKGERKSIGGTIWYQLSHCSIRKDVKKQVVVNWFGICGRNKLRIPKGALPQKENLCEICGEKLYDIVYKGDYKSLLAFMAGFKDSQGFLMDAKDRDGNWLWSAEHKDRYKSG
jgi:hypothetical protein